MKDEKNNEIFSSASACECTGLIPEGGNHSPEEIDTYREIMPFAMPAKDKGFDSAEMKKTKKLNRL